MSAAVELLPAAVASLFGPPHLTSSADRVGAQTGPEVTARLLWQLLLPPAEPDCGDANRGSVVGTSHRELSPGAVVLGAPGTRSVPGRGHSRPGGLSAAGSAGSAAGAGRPAGLLPRARTPPVAGSGPALSPSGTRPDLTDDVDDFGFEAGSVLQGRDIEDGQQVVEQAAVRRVGELPDPRPLAGQLAQAVVEVLSGDRPLTQLLTRVDEQIYAELSALAPDPVTSSALQRARGMIRPQDRPRVRSVHVSQPAADVAEVAARIQTNGRSRAIALRLEEWRGRWRCSALVVG